MLVLHTKCRTCLIVFLRQLWEDVALPQANESEQMRLRCCYFPSPFIRPILAADDAIWTYNILHAIVSQSPSLAAELSPELQRLARSPTAAQDAEGVSLQARLILAGGPP